MMAPPARPGDQERGPQPRFPEKMRVAIYAGLFIKDYDGATKTLFELIRSLRERRGEGAGLAFSSPPSEASGVAAYRVSALPPPITPISFPISTNAASGT